MSYTKYAFYSCASLHVSLSKYRRGINVGVYTLFRYSVYTLTLKSIGHCQGLDVISPSLGFRPLFPCKQKLIKFINLMNSFDT